MDAGIATEDVADSPVAFELRELFATLVREAFADLESDRPNLRAHARAWFTSDDRSGPTTFLVVCEALGINPSSIRGEVFRRLEAMTMGEPKTVTFACERCGSEFQHTYPQGFGKKCRFCPNCKSSRHGEQRRAPSASREGSAVSKPRTPSETSAKNPLRFLADLTREREALSQQIDELDAVITFLSRRYGVEAEVSA